MFSSHTNGQICKYLVMNSPLSVFVESSGFVYEDVRPFNDRCSTDDDSLVDLTTEEDEEVVKVELDPFDVRQVSTPSTNDHADGSDKDPVGDLPNSIAGIKQ